MKNRWAPGFTIVELIIVVVVIAILATISIVGYNGATKLALSTAAKSDLQNVSTAMAQELRKHAEYPEQLPVEVKASNRITLNFIGSGELPYYKNLNAVQGGMVMAKACQDLVDAGYGKGTSQGSQLRDYVTGCGNWNDDSMQVTGWDSKVWPTPVQKQALLEYGNNFHTSNTWDIDQDRVMKNFYTQMVSRYEQMGGTFPVTSFWDYWATPTNGGVMAQPLDANAPTRPYYCVEAEVQGQPELIWHVTESGKIESGSC